MTLGPLVVIGAGGHGREVVAIARACGVDVLGVVDDGRPDPALLDRLAVRLLGTSDWWATASPTGFVAGLGYPAPRRATAARAAAAGSWPGRLVHPGADIGPDVELADGVVVWPGATVTTRVVVGRHTHLNVACSVSHDAVLGEHVTVGPGARVCGAVVLADDVWLGAGAVVVPGRTLGVGAVVGAGAVVLDDVAPGLVVAGVPARPVRSRRPRPRDAGG